MSKLETSHLQLILIRAGDWEIIGISDRKVKLRCPISSKEFEWNRFCYFTEERNGKAWPHED
jgi:hypothetical protein